MDKNVVNLLDPSYWNNISSEIQDEFLRQAELMAKETVTIAIGADHRSTTTMNIFGAGGVALLAASATLIVNARADWILICAPAVSALGLLVAAVLCARAVAPVRFLLPGARPASMVLTDTANMKNFKAALVHSADRTIKHNMGMIVRAAKWYELSLYVAGASILTGIGFISLWASRLGYHFS